MLFKLDLYYILRKLKVAPFMKKSSVKNRALIIGLSIAFVLCFLLCACDTTSAPPSSTPQSPSASTFVCVDINPSIEMVLDQNDRVMSVYGANEDAQLLLWEEDGIVGVDVDLAIQRIVSIAKDMGYVSDEAQNVCVSIETILQGATSTILSKIESGITSVARNLTTLANDTSLSLSKELEKIKLSSNGKYDSLSESKYHLVKRAMQSDSTLSLDSALALGEDKLILKVKDAQSQATKKLGDVYTATVNEAQLAFDNSKATLLDAQFVKFFLTQLEQKLQAGDYLALQALAPRVVAALKYVANHQAYIILEKHKTMLEQYATNPQIDSLKLDDVLQNFEGVISRQAIDNFKTKHKDDSTVDKQALLDLVNTQYRNASPSDRARFEDAYDQALLTIANSIYQNEKKLDEIERAVSQNFNDVLAHLNGGFHHVASLYDESALKIDYSSIEAVKEALSLYQERMEQAYKDMLLTKEDLQQIEQMQALLEQDINLLQEQFTNKVLEAKEHAESILSSRKDEKMHENKPPMNHHK